jgi:thiol-disulfide isomerase/thioredoxin
MIPFTNVYAQLVPVPEAVPSARGDSEIDARPWLGVAMDNRDGHVIITRTIPASPARAAGIQRNTRIVRVDGHEVAASSDVIARVGVRSAGDTLALDLEIDGVFTTITVTLVARPSTDNISDLLIGTPLPSHAVRDVALNTTAPAAKAGRVSVIEFWATWCGPCAALRPRMADLRGSRSEAELSIVAVSSEEHALIAEYASEHPMPYRVASDRGGELSAELFVMALPSWAVVDVDGNIVGFYSGTDEFDAMIAQVDALLSP